MAQNIPLTIAAHSKGVPENLNARLVNMFAEKAPEGAVSPVVHRSAPGLELYKTIGTGPIRGWLKMDGHIIAASGTEVYKIDTSGTATLLGAISGTGPVSMAHNGTQCVVVVPGGLSYVATLSTVVQITDPDFLTCDSVQFLDGYFIFQVTGNDEWIWSAITDGTDYDALDYATAESSPDDLSALVVDHREIWLMGEETTEIWYNSGAPFSRRTTFEKGCIGNFAACKADNTVFWMAPDFTIYRADDYTPKRISTHDIETAIAESASPEDAVMFAHLWQGHVFMYLCLSDATYVYDVATNKWHERMSRIDGFDGPFRCNSHLFFNGKHYLGDALNGNIYRLSENAFDENGEVLIRFADLLPLQHEGKLVTVDKFVVLARAGVGTGSGQGADPQVMITVSKDAGRTWGNLILRSLGAIGEYNNRVVVNSLGDGRNIIFRLKVTDPVQFDVVRAFIEGEVADD